MKNVKNKSRFKLSTRILSLILSVVLLFLFIPTVVYAEVIEALGSSEPRNENTKDSTAYSENNENTEPIYTYKGATYEETSLREEAVKHFRLEDGSYVAAQYGMPVHYTDDAGIWQDIDNSLSEISGMYANSTARIKFAKKINGSAVLFTLKDGNTKLEMSLIGANKGVVPTVINGEDAEAETELQKLMNLEKLSSTIVYPEILDGVDVEYIAQSLNVKENIIVKEREESYSYSFELKLNGLAATLAENGDIEIFNAKSGEVAYVIPAPVVYDAGGKYAPKSASSFSLTDKGNSKYILTVNASSEWMNADERTFPITIDPTIERPYSGEYVGYTLLSTDTLGGNAESERLYVIDDELSGNGALSTIHFMTPVGFYYEYVSRIEINLYCTSGSGYVGAFEPDGTWFPGDVSWNDLQQMYEPYSSTPMDFHYVTEGSYYSFDISDIAFNCARNDKPTSFAVIAPMTNDTWVEFNNMTESFATAPYMLTEYRNMSGIESYWPTSSHSVGNAGTGTVNLANGNLTFEIPLLSSTDSLMPIGVSAVYNLNRYDVYQGYMPAGFHLNIAETITKKTYKNNENENVTYYVNTDSDGTEHAYHRGWYWDEQDNEREYNDIFFDEDGLQKTLKLNDYTNPTTSIVLTDDSKIKMHFLAWDASNWYLSEIEDLSGNKVIINYDTSAKRPTSVSLKPKNTAPINMINFHYNTEGKLYIIDNDTANEAIFFDLSNTETSYDYTPGSRYLRKLTKYNGGKTFNHQNWESVAATGNLLGATEVYSSSYSYRYNGFLREVIDNNSNYRVVYSLYDYVTFSFFGWIEEFSGDELGKTVNYSVDYFDNERMTCEKTYDRNGIDDKTIYYYMDSYGRATCIYDTSTATAVNYEYENSYKIKNNVKLEYASPALQKNYLVNTLVSHNNGTLAPYWKMVNSAFYAEHYHRYPYAVLQPTYSHSNATMTQEPVLKNGTYSLSFDYSGENEENLESLVKIYVYDDEFKKIEERIATDEELDSGRYTVSFSVNSSSGYADIWIRIETKYLLESANIDSDSDGLADSHIKINNLSLSDGASSVYTNIVNDGTFENKTYVSYDDAEGNSVSTYLQAAEYWKAYTKSLDDNSIPAEQTLVIKPPIYNNSSRLELTGEIEKVVYAKQTVYTAHDEQLNYFDTYANKSAYNSHFNFYVGSQIDSYGTVANEDSGFGIYVEISYYQGNGETVKRGIFVEARKAIDWVAQALLDTKCPAEEKESGKYYGCISSIDLFLVAYNQPNGSIIYFDDVAFVFVDDAPVVENTYNGDGLVNKTQVSFDLSEYYYYDSNRNLIKVANDKGVITEYNYDTSNRVSSVESYTFSYSDVDEDEATKWQGETSEIVITPEQMTVYDYDAYGLVREEMVCSFFLNDNGDPIADIEKQDYRTIREHETSSGSKIFGALLAEGSGYEMIVQGNELLSLDLEECDNAKRYFYEIPSGRLSAEVSINGNWGMEYCYNDMGEISTVFPAVYDMTASGESYDSVTDENYAMYFYNESNQLSRIHSNGVLYNFSYGDFGNATQVGINYNTIIISYEYYENNGNIKKTTYANGSVVNYVYNNLDLLSEIWYTEIDEENSSPAYAYKYDKLGRLLTVTDHTLNTAAPAITEYQYDEMGNVRAIYRYTNVSDGDISAPVYDSFTKYSYNKNYQITGCTDKISYTAGGASHFHTLGSVGYTYNNLGYLERYRITFDDTGASSAQNYQVEYSYDEFNRLVERSVNNIPGENPQNYFHNFSVTESFTYDNTNVSSYSISLVDSVENASSMTYFYEYDADGNITLVWTVDNEDELYVEIPENATEEERAEILAEMLAEIKEANSTHRYYYDEIGQLIRVDDIRENRTVVYTYDFAGNITKKEHFFLTAAGATPEGIQEVYTYTYDNSNWQDQLTEYNETTITYDANGNPLSYYNGLTFSWNGRQLSGYTQGNVTYTYTYDADGMRTSRTERRLNGTEIVTNYLYNGSLLVSEETNGNITAYIYDPSGLPIGFRYHKSSYAAGVWDCYYYVKNVQGDIVEIYNDNGTSVVCYSYDEYGKPTAHNSGNGDEMANINHLMYRGYYYDFRSHNNTDGFQGGLGLYYLGSRYYDANIGRFISPDDISYLGANGDLNGFNLYAYCSNNPVMYSDPSGHFVISTLIIGALVGAAVSAAIDVGTQLISNGGDFSEVDWGSVASSSFIGAAIGFSGTIGGATLGAFLAGSSTLTAAGVAGWFGLSMGASMAGGFLGYSSEKIINGESWNCGSAIAMGGLTMLSGAFSYGAGAISGLVNIPGKLSNKIAQNFVNDIFSAPISWITDEIGGRL